MRDGTETLSRSSIFLPFIGRLQNDLAAERGLDSFWIEPLGGFERDAITAHWRGGSVRRQRRVIEIALRARKKAAVQN